MAEDNEEPVYRLEWEQMRRRQQEHERELSELKAGMQQVLDLGNALGNLWRVFGSLGSTQPVKLKPEDSAQRVLPEYETVEEIPKLPKFFIREWRTWIGFRSNMQRREKTALERQEQNGTSLPITKELLAGQSGGDSVRNIGRAMEYYGLDKEADWPPSTWPEQQPGKHLRHRDLHSLMAAALLPPILLLLDVVSDGRFNHVANLFRLAGCEFSRILG